MQTTRPSTRHEREQIQTWLKGFMAEEAEVEAKALLEAHFMPIATHYAQCCLAADEAVGRYQEACLVADAQDEVVDGKARRWFKSVTDDAGHALSDELKTLLGMKPSAVLRLPYREELSRLRALFPRLPSRLHGDPAAQAALVAAMDEMEPLLAAQEKAQGEKLAANQQLFKAEDDFDTAWGKQVRLLKALMPEEAQRKLPVFARVKTKAPTEA